MSKKSEDKLSIHPTPYRFGLFRVRSPLLTESCFSSQNDTDIVRLDRTYRVPKRYMVLVHVILQMKKEVFCYFLFLWLLRCFTSPGLPHHTMDSYGSNTTLLVLGSPIRTSTDQRLLGTSPWLIAPCDVLHRWIVSRHPPYALQVRTAKTHNCAFCYTLPKNTMYNGSLLHIMICVTCVMLHMIGWTYALHDVKLTIWFG